MGICSAKIALRKLRQMLIRSGEIPSPRQTSIDNTNDCAMRSERWSQQCSHNGRWYVTGAGQGFDTNILRRIWALLCRKQATKILDTSPMTKK